MHAANFETLCAGFCELAQTASPRLSPDSDGLLAFHLERRGVLVNVMYIPATAAELAFVSFDLGATAAPDHDECDILRALLRGNFAPLQANPPTFACHPLTDKAVLQCTLPIRDSEPRRLHELVEQGVEIVIRWRADFFLSENHTETDTCPRV